MLLTCLGHAKFLIELNSGLRIVTDPFDAACGYPLTETQADAVLVSHGHHDHSAVETISGNPRIIREAGTYTLESGVTVTAIPAFHDEVQGAKRGSTLLFLLEGGLLDWAEAKKVTQDVCAALWVLHSMGAVHRDVKESNVILRGGEAVLIDFDAARLHKPEHETDTQVLGTTGFAAPEQYGDFDIVELWEDAA